MKENIITGKKYRIVNDAALDIWDRISFWTKASDVHYNDNSTAEDNRPVNLLQRGRAYTVGTIVYEPTAPSWVLLKCTTAGTTALTTPTGYSTIHSVGQVISDNTAKFTVYDVRPQSTLSTSAYQIPTISLVDSLNSQLVANDKSFQFAYDSAKDKYGFKVGGGSFIPFGASDELSKSDFTLLTDSIKGTSTFTAETDGTYLIWLETSNIDRDDDKYPKQTHYIYINNVAISSNDFFFSKEVTGERENQYYAARTTLAFVNLSAGDTVRGRRSDGVGPASYKNIFVWKLTPQ